MKKAKTRFVCQSCGYISPKWLGKCIECETWNSLVEELDISGKQSSIRTSRSKPTLLKEIDNSELDRTNTNIMELDRVLGGGFVKGSVVLLGGDPGIGKSTLAIQILNNLGINNQKVLYVTGEESTNQINLRSKRLGLNHDEMILLSETEISTILEHTKSIDPDFIVIDSIQTIYNSELSTSPGSIGQIKECGTTLAQYAKNSNKNILLIGHVTKNGAIAGPKVLEHLVDTVLYFEGGKGHPYRILRTVKNRFGSTNEIGVFEMLNKGLIEVANPSEIFLSEKPENSTGSVVIPSIEGTRPILVEIQALVSQSNVAVPRRTTLGLDSNKVSLLIAVLDKIAGIHFIGNDVFMNVAGGVRLEEPAIDLGICISLTSSFLNKTVSNDTVVFGEIGLTGEVRGVSQVDLRLAESEKLGFKKCILPKINMDNLSTAKDLSVELVGVKSINETLEILF